jgi:hypothetical protein
MNLCIESKSAFVQCKPESLDALIDRLERAGYEPLLRKVAHQFANVFGGSVDDFANAKSEQEEDEDSSRDNEDIRRQLVNLEKLGYRWGIDNLRGFAHVPEVKGDFFYNDERTAILFVTIVDMGIKKEGANSNCAMRAGFIGNVDEKTLLKDFTDAIGKALEEMGFDADWTADDVSNKTFDELGQLERETNFQSATAVSDKELKAARVLENSSVREVATLVRRSGVMLAKELLRQKAEQASDIIRYVDQLLQVNILHQEYVVVCQKSGAHVNRVESRDVIDQMARLGVLCSCGKPISDEQIEGLLASDPLLPRMLDNNYWMAATVVRQLNALNVPNERILIDISPSGEDVEMFADIDGTLVMFELKDAEYGLNNAYSLGARIGMHRPHLAFVVSTKGIASEVKDHFKRIKPETKLVYVANLIQLEATLKKVVEGVRATRVRTWLAYFESMLSFPIVPLVLPKLQSARFEIPHVVTSVQVQPEAHEREAEQMPAQSAAR